MTRRESSERRNSRVALGLILLLSFLLNLLPAWWGLPAWDGWAWDEISPKDVHEAHLLRFSNGWAGPYPPLQYYLLWPVTQPIRWLRDGGTIALNNYELESLLQLILRLVSVVMATGTTFLAYRVSRISRDPIGRDRATSCAAALSAALVCPFLYYAKTANLDVPYLFWFSLSLLFYLRALTRGRLGDYLALAAAAVAAVTTKDQALFLYVFPALWLLADLRRRHRDTGVANPLLAALRDRRVLGSSVLALVLFVLIHNWVFNFDGFVKHLEFITGRSPNIYKNYSHTIADHMRMGWQNLKHLRFSLGLPALLAALAGIGLVARRWRQERAMLSLLLFPLSYYLLFISVILHDFVRFLLPVCFVLSLFGAHALATLAASRRFRPVALSAVAGVLLYSFFYAYSVDLMMLFDSRYEVEKMLLTRLRHGEKAVSVGRHPQLPRNIQNVSWSKLAWRPSALRYLDARFIIASSSDVWTDEERTVYYQLHSGTRNYRRVATIRGNPPYNLLDIDGIQTNLRSVSTDQVIFERIREFSDDEASFFDRLHSLREQSDPVAHDPVARDPVARDPVAHEELRRLAETTWVGTGRPILDDVVVAYGLTDDGWMRDRDAACLVVRNPTSQPLAPLVVVASYAPADERPTFILDSGDAQHRFAITGTGPTTIRLSPVAPGATELFRLTVDRCWKPPGNDPRCLGVRFLPLEERPLEPSDDSRMLGIGLTDDLWTTGDQTAAVLLRNTTAEPYTAILRLTAGPTSGAKAIRTRIEGRGFETQQLFTSNTQLDVTLPTVEPHSTRLVFFLRDDESRVDGDPTRVSPPPIRLGVGVAATPTP